MLKKVRITNFKSLEDVSVNLEEITVLVGRSGSGKTNFVEALRFVRQLLYDRNWNFIYINPLGWQRFIPATVKLPVTMSFEFIFSVDGIDGNYKYKLAFTVEKIDSVTIAEETLKLKEELLFCVQNGGWLHPPKVLNPPNPLSLVLGSISGMQEIAVAYVSLTSGLGCYDFPTTVLGETSQPSKLAGFSDSGSNYFQSFAAIENNLQAISNWKEIIAALKVLDPSIRSIETGKPENGKIIVSHDIGERILQLNLDQESEGFRRYLSHLIALYQSPPKQTLIFEEAEKGIHPGALEALAEQFLACPNSKRGQIVLTTHSPELLNKFDVADIRVVEIRNHLTQIGPVAKDQLDSIKEKLMTTGELLTVNKARIADATTYGAGA